MDSVAIWKTAWVTLVGERLLAIPFAKIEIPGGKYKHNSRNLNQKYTSHSALSQGFNQFLSK
jgi:hypothetical protein